MPEITPNSKGPAPAQMSPEWLASLGATPTPEAAAPTEPVLIPAGQVKPEDIGTLSIEYRDGQPVIVVSSGTYIPAGLPVVDGSGNVVTTYTAARVSKAEPGISSQLGDPTYGMLFQPDWGSMFPSDGS